MTRVTKPKIIFRLSNQTCTYMPHKKTHTLFKPRINKSLTFPEHSQWLIYWQKAENTTNIWMNHAIWDITRQPTRCGQLILFSLLCGVWVEEHKSSSTWKTAESDSVSPAGRDKAPMTQADRHTLAHYTWLFLLSLRLPVNDDSAVDWILCHNTNRNKGQVNCFSQVSALMGTKEDQQNLLWLFSSVPERGATTPCLNKFTTHSLP